MPFQPPYNKLANGAFINSSRETMVNQKIFSGDFNTEIRYHGTARRHNGSLHISRRRRKNFSVGIKFVKYPADDMEIRSNMRPNAKEYTDCFSDICLERIFARKRANPTVEGKILRLFLLQFFQTECLMAFLANLACCIPFALHDIVFAVNLREPLFWLNKNHSVHAICDMCGNVRACAMVHINARTRRIELECARFPGCDLCQYRSAAGAFNCVQINGVFGVARLGMLVRSFGVVAVRIGGGSD